MEKNELEEQVNDIIHCFICFLKVYKPYMCPKCHKLCCHNCLIQWYENGGKNCAMCKTSLNIDQFIPVPWMDDLSLSASIPLLNSIFFGRLYAVFSGSLMQSK